MCTRVCVCGFCPLFFFFPSAHNLIARRRPARIFEYGNIFRKRFEPYPCIEEVIFLIFFVKKPGINRRKNRNMYDDGFVIFSIYFLFVATRLKNKRGNPEHSHGKLTLGSSVRGRIFKIFWLFSNWSISVWRGDFFFRFNWTKPIWPNRNTWQYADTRFILNVILNGEQKNVESRVKNLFCISFWRKS